MIQDGARATLGYSVIDDGESTVKKGRHRRYEEARALKRGPDLDIEALFTDLEGEPALVAAVVEDPLSEDAEADDEADLEIADYLAEDDDDIED
jgi:hypothetical protein